MLKLGRGCGEHLKAARRELASSGIGSLAFVFKLDVRQLSRSVVAVSASKRTELRPQKVS